MLQKLRQDDFYQQIGKLAVPIVLQNLLNAAVNSVDVVMLNFVGQSAISAVSLATQYASILHMVYYGLGSGITMLCAQYFGKKDFRAIQTVEGIALRFSLIISVIFAILALSVPETLMWIFTDDNELIELGATYLRVLSVGYLCWAIIEVYLSVLRSIGRVTICTVLNGIAVGTNVVLNAVFIFGLFGAPKLGVLGVAIATSASRLLQLVLCFIVSARSENAKIKFSYIFIRNKLLFRDFIKLSIPALANDIVWGTGFAMYSAIWGHMSADAVAANSITLVARNFGTVLCFGFASAGGILLGQVIGTNDLERARLYAKKLLRVTVVTGAVGGIIILYATPFILKFTSLSPTAEKYLLYMLLMNSYYVMGVAINTTLIVGVFRSGGDSRFGAICDFIDMWIYAIPLGCIAAFLLKLPVPVVYFLICTDEFAKWPWVFKRYRSGKWLRNITRDDLFDDSAKEAKP